MKHKLDHSTKCNITDHSCPIQVLIRINGIVHLKFLKTKYLAVLSWYNSKNDFRIEIYLKGKTLKTAYNSVEKWKAILEILNDQV